MLTRRDFLARTAATLVALGAGIRPMREKSVINLSQLLTDPTNEQFWATPVFDLLLADIGEANPRLLSMPMLDSFGISAKIVAHRIDDVEEAVNV